MANKQKITLFFLLLIFAWSIYISWIFTIPSIVFSLFFDSILIYIFYGLYKKWKDSSYLFFSQENYKIFLYEFLYKVSSLIVLFIIMTWWFAYYQNDISPVKMPIYQITNGNKKVVFQAMSHIWTPNFYENVKNNIITFKKLGYVLYFEWVKPWSVTNQKAFDRALGIKLDSKTYENMSKLYGLTNQDNSKFLWLINDLDYNIDITIDDIMEKYSKEKLISGVQNRTYTQPIDITTEIINELSQIRENELKVLRYINKSFINVIIKSENLQTAIQSAFTDKELFHVILDKRNEVLSKKIIESQDTKIIITYGLLHFQWVFELLKQNDIKWRIEKIDYLYPIK